MMAPNFLPTLVWLLVVVTGVATIAEAVNRREGVRQVAQIVLGALLVLAFVANVWAGFTHWAECSDDPWGDGCEEDES